MDGLLRDAWARASLAALTVSEVRRLLWALQWDAPADPDAVLRWSWWRRHHQALARSYHYRRRGARSP